MFAVVATIYYRKHLQPQSNVFDSSSVSRGVSKRRGFNSTRWLSMTREILTPVLKRGKKKPLSGDLSLRFVKSEENTRKG